MEGSRSPEASGINHNPENGKGTESPTTPKRLTGIRKTFAGLVMLAGTAFHGQNDNDQEPNKDEPPKP